MATHAAILIIILASAPSPKLYTPNTLAGISAISTSSIIEDVVWLLRT